MRVGIAGKGGVGKTTISAILARTLSRRGHRVVAVDCDSNPTLAIGSGVDEPAAGTLRPLLDQTNGRRSVPKDLSPTELIDQYGFDGPDGITLLLGARAERAGAG
ncbi:MAG: AAA family ATPase [Acidimicrobiales bacterium]